MKIPVEISARNVFLTNEMEDLIREKAEKLDTFYDDMISCRIMVEVPHRSQRKGVQYHVRIDMTVPGGELVVKREPHEDLHAAIVNAFDAAERQVKTYSSKQRGEVKVHAYQKPLGRVSKLFPDEGYGFITTMEGVDYYFHENAVLGGKFDDLEIGTAVTFVEGTGDKGPQASSVSIEKRS